MSIINHMKKKFKIGLVTTLASLLLLTFNTASANLDVCVSGYTAECYMNGAYATICCQQGNGGTTTWKTWVSGFQCPSGYSVSGNCCQQTISDEYACNYVS